MRGPEGQPPIQINDSDIIGPVSDTGKQTKPIEVTDSQILGPADGPEEVTDSQILGPADDPIEVTDSQILGPADSTEDTTKPVEIRPIMIGRERSLAPPEAVEGTGPVESAELARERRDGMVAKLDAIPEQMKDAAVEAANMIPRFEITQPLVEEVTDAEIVGPAESPEQAEMRRLADEMREVAEQADDLAREWNARALSLLEAGSDERLSRAVDFLKKWPDNGKDLADAGLNEVEQAFVALRFAKKDPEGFVRAMQHADLGLSTDEKAAIAEEIRDTSPNDLPRALKAMKLPTEHVTDIIRGITPELRSRTFNELGIPEVGASLHEDVSTRLETRERENTSIRQFREVSNAISLEVMRAFPDQVRQERERHRIESELGGKMTEARDFGDTAAAPMLLKIEGRDLPAIYKATAREVASREKFKKENNGQDLRPGIEADTVPNREWLAYQIDKALQLDVVPVTVMREGPEGLGSVQDWQVSEGLVDKPYFKWAKEDENFRNQLAKVAFLDRAIENTDRHQKNFLRSPDGKVIAIDNGLSQARPDSPSDRVQSFPIYALEGGPIPPALIQAAERLEANQDLKAALKKAFDAALGDDSKRAWKAFNSRLGEMKKKGKFPTTKELEKEGNSWHLMNEGKIELQRRGLKLEFSSEEGTGPPV